MVSAPFVATQEREEVDSVRAFSPDMKRGLKLVVRIPGCALRYNATVNRKPISLQTDVASAAVSPICASAGRTLTSKFAPTIVTLIPPVVGAKSGTTNSVLGAS
eukprot:621865-Rhodomonas_salina.2